MRTEAQPIWDDETLASLYRVCFPYEKHPWTAKSFREFRNASYVHYVESPESVLIYQLVSDEAEILLVMTKPDARQKGAASKCLAQALDKMKALKIESVFLEVAAGNLPAQAFYSRFGFEEIGLRARYYQRTNGEYDDALILQKRISDVESS